MSLRRCFGSSCLALFFAAAAASAATLPRARPSALAPEDVARIPRDGSHVFLQPIAFDPTAVAPDFSETGLPAESSGEYGVVQFVQDALHEKDRLAHEGVRFFGYLPDNAFQVKLTPRARALLSASPGVRWLGPYAPGFKVHPRLWARARDSRPEVIVVLFEDASPDTVERALAARFPDAVRTQRNDGGRWPTLRFAVPDSVRAAFVAAASALDGTVWIEPWSEPRVWNNDALGPVQSSAATALSAGRCTTCTVFNHNITGTGQVVAVADTGLDSDMCFFRYGPAAADVTDAENTLPPAPGSLSLGKKVVGYWVQPGATAYDNNADCNGNPVSFHGTHTSATAAGDNYLTRSTPTFAGVDPGDGMAPNAQILFQDLGNDQSGCLVSFPDPSVLYLQALAGGARVHSNSYGSPGDGTYGTSDRVLDAFLFDHEDMAMFFAAGNDGPGPSTIGSPGNSKSAIAVGALAHGNAAQVANFSSRGPTVDGRIKPDIMAPGVGTVSAAGNTNHTDANCATKALSGTSMATPTAAGAAALLRQYFADGFYPTGVATASNRFEPSAPLVKAALVNGAMPLGTFGDQTFGWGRVFLDNNLFFAGDLRSLRVWSLPNTQGLTTGMTQAYTVNVAAGQEFRATVVWFDAEGTPGAGITLVNNLDLSVSDGTNLYRGNVFDASGVSVTGGASDARNTVENVRLAAPAAGAYTITVTAASVPGNGRTYTNRQGYALVVSAGGCATAVTGVPTGLSVAPNPVMGADLAWTPAPGSQATQIYRALGSCAAGVEESPQFVGSTTGTTFTDTRAQGGESYEYILRGVDNCGEGPPSACVTVTATGRCDLVPTFAGAASVAPAGTACRVHLSWAAGSSHCTAGPAVHYNVYRSTASDFTPAPGNRIASVNELFYDDDTVASATTYYYIVRAEDSSPGGPGPNGGNEDSNLVKSYATATGAPAALGTWTDDGGDSIAALRPEAPWQVTTRQAQSGSRSYHCGPDSGNYAANLCAALTTPDLALGTGSVLSYFARYNCELEWDGVVVEISIDGGTTWSNLAPNSGYPDTLSQTQGNGCGFPPTQGAFTGPSGNIALTPWAPYQTALSPAYDGRTVRIRWRFTSDPGAEFEGFYVDTIAVTNVHLPGACMPVVAPSPPAPILPARTRSHTPPTLPPRTP